jgi:membrane fusion protein (multidrug efflux system)
MTSTSSKQEAESQVRILQQQEKATAFQTSVIKAKRIDKQTDVAANIKKSKVMLSLI